jgi:hypothetical protein
MCLFGIEVSPPPSCRASMAACVKVAAKCRAGIHDYGHGRFWSTSAIHLMCPHRFAMTKAAWTLPEASPVPSDALLWTARCAFKATSMAPSSLRLALQRRAPVWLIITAFGMSSSAPDFRRQARMCAEPPLSPLSYAPSGLETRAGPVLVARTAPEATNFVRFQTITYCPRRRVSSSLVRRYAASDGTCSALKRSVPSVTQVSTDARAHMCDVRTRIRRHICAANSCMQRAHEPHK